MLISAVNLYSTPTQPEKEKLNEIEKQSFDRATRWRENGTAYAQEHGTRPSTIGHVLSSNPLALLAW